MTATTALPSIDFDMLTDLKSKMARFTTRFDAFILAGREQLKRENDEFVAGLAEDKVLREAQLEGIARIEQDKEEIKQALEVEHQEIAAMEADITEYSQKRDDMLLLKETLQQQLEETSNIHKERSQSLQQQKNTLSQQNQQNRPELRMWETTLGLRIEASERDRLRLIFTDIAPDVTKMHTVLLDLTDGYKVVEFYPTVVVDCVNELNDSGDFGRFLRKIRNEFVALYR